ncbi:MAG: prolyl-tRNA synthetase associated domain-containing protein [Proteobacteria bacterium]|nr:prolyl-tRNA synthetase associated domain-containing protein [Pseudomonadota bacterium]
MKITLLSAPLSDDPSTAVFDLFEKLEIRAKTYEHEPHNTVAESRLAHHLMPGLHTKNLFVKDKASQLYLITAEAESPLDLKSMDKVIGAKGRLSFASADQMMTHLGIVPGCVSPLALVNEKQGAVRFVIEKKLLEAELINVHPLINTRTTALEPARLLAVLAATGHPPLITELPYRQE